MNKLAGANMDIDLATPANQISWHQAKCPWNTREGNTQHLCAVKACIHLSVFLWGRVSGYPVVLFPGRKPVSNAIIK